jgi:Flp pilus assembly protein TadD
MKTSTLVKLGSSALLLGATAVGCTTTSRVAGIGKAPRGGLQSARLAAGAGDAIKARKTDQAIALAEKAVALDPQNAANRATLGQAYMAGGRFLSAETSFGEALSLDPSLVRTRFSLALTQIALGKRDAARSSLAMLGDAVSDADLGLATALAGDTPAGITILERGARAPEAGAKARQNLALAYAMAGRWTDAQAVAEQDVPADQLALRLSQWAQFARPDSSSAQVSSLLGVTLVADQGRPTALALAVPAQGPAVALAAAGPVPTSGGSVAEPFDTTAAETQVAAFVAPAPAARRPMVLAASPQTGSHRGFAQGKWVIQLGAYSQARGVQAAWTRIASRVTGAHSYAPGRSTFAKGGSATLYRLTLSGFAGRDSAQRMCEGIRAKGSPCFVRPAAGEQPMLMAANLNSKIAMR